MRKWLSLTGHNSSYIPSQPSFQHLHNKLPHTYLSWQCMFSLSLFSKITSLQCMLVWRCEKNSCWMRYYSVFVRMTELEAQFFSGKKNCAMSIFWTIYWRVTWTFAAVATVWYIDYVGSQNFRLPHSFHDFEEMSFNNVTRKHTTKA